MTTNDKITELASEFVSLFGRRPDFVACAPGRVNLIGEHTDYNRGLVLPLALQQGIQIGVATRSDAIVRLYSNAFDQTVQFDLNSSLEKDAQRSWADYVKGVAQAMKQDGYTLSGFDGLIDGDVPVASGLSSSAALEVATVTAFLQLDHRDRKTPPHTPPLTIAKLARKAEVEFVGVNCGLMDQFISAAGVEGCALQIDCSSMDFTPVPIPSDVSFLVIDTKLSRTLAGSAYNQRRFECEQALDLINSYQDGSISYESLSDIEIETLDERRQVLSDRLFRRVRHVVTENQRVKNVVAALQECDLVRIGELFNQSHFSLRDDYEVSSPGLDQITSWMREIPGCFGARMTGAGFGGCAVAVVDSKARESVSQAFLQMTEAHKPRPEIFEAIPSDGARIHLAPLNK